MLYALARIEQMLIDLIGNGLLPEWINSALRLTHNKGIALQ